MIRIACPACQTALKVSNRKAGTLVSCLKCGQRLLVPRAGDLPRKEPLVGRLLWDLTVQLERIVLGAIRNPGVEYADLLSAT